MDFFALVDERKSVRAFDDRGIEPKKLERLLQAVNRAPSAGNLQAYEILLVRDAARKRGLVSAAQDQEYLAQAPVVLVFCAHPARAAAKYGGRGEALYALQDATIACTFAMLAAVELGLASVWIGAFEDQAVAATLNLPSGWQPVAMLPIGYAARIPERTARRALEDLVHEL